MLRSSGDRAPLTPARSQQLLKEDMVSEKQLPTSRLGRLSRLATVGARSGLSILARGSGDAAAEQALAVLGNLRGLAAKVGQMASYVDGLVPVAQREAYERVLTSLQASTPSSPFESVRELIEGELGAKLADLFAEFDPTPFASASIGQVHRAKLPDGTEVAVKVQHSGIEAAFETDITSAGSMVNFVSVLAPRGIGARALHDEMAMRLREELDYRLEAERQATFASFHVGDPDIHVPKISARYSSQRVLTSELVHGHDFAWATQAPEPLRKHYAEVLWRFVFKAILVHGMFNADPHPGNYRFHEDGKVTFLDFGSVQVLAPHFLAASRDMHDAAIRGDQAAYKRAAAIACQTKPGAYETELLDYLWMCFLPLRESPFKLTREYATEVVTTTRNMKRHLLDKKANITPPPHGVMLMNRLQFGFYSVLARLDVTVDYAGIERALMKAVGL
ncbi:MAG: hypothetical protein RL701_7698 [Pseudomonadota bacterium]